jgi:topoisomerase IA-like protein
MASLKPQTANDLEEFLALEQIKEHEHNLKQLMIYQGRAGLWSDFIAYQAEARKRRKQERLEAEKAREELIEGLAIAGSIILGFAGAAFILYLIFIR